MGGGHSGTDSTQSSGLTINVTDPKSTTTISNITDAGGSITTGSNSTGATVKTGVTANIVPALLQNLAMQGIDVSSIKNIVVAKTTGTQNPGVQVANATNVNPGVVVADKTSSNPGVQLYENISTNAGVNYYKSLLSNPGLQLYLNQHPTILASEQAAIKADTVANYQALIQNPGLKYYIEQNANTLGPLALGTPYLI